MPAADCFRVITTDSGFPAAAFCVAPAARFLAAPAADVVTDADITDAVRFPGFIPFHPGGRFIGEGATDDALFKVAGFSELRPWGAFIGVFFLFGAGRPWAKANEAGLLSHLSRFSGESCLRSCISGGCQGFRRMAGIGERIVLRDFGPYWIWTERERNGGFVFELKFDFEVNSQGCQVPTMELDL